MGFLRSHVYPIGTGILTAFAVMMLFEFTNSFLFPFPEGFDTRNVQLVRQFVVEHSPFIFVLVWCGWLCGSVLAGYVTTRISKEHIYLRSAFAGLILMGAGIVNDLLLAHPLWFNLTGFPVFIIGTYIGHRLYLRSADSKSGS